MLIFRWLGGYYKEIVRKSERAEKTRVKKVELLKQQQESVRSPLDPSWMNRQRPGLDIEGTNCGRLLATS